MRELITLSKLTSTVIPSIDGPAGASFSVAKEQHGFFSHVVSITLTAIMSKRVWAALLIVGSFANVVGPRSFSFVVTCSDRWRFG